MVELIISTAQGEDRDAELRPAVEQRVLLHIQEQE